MISRDEAGMTIRETLHEKLQFSERVQCYDPNHGLENSRENPPFPKKDVLVGDAFIDERWLVNTFVIKGKRKKDQLGQ